MEKNVENLGSEVLLNDYFSLKRSKFEKYKNVEDEDTEEDLKFLKRKVGNAFKEFNKKNLKK